MAKDEKILSVSEGVKWLGVLDFDIVTFDIVMETEYGTTYNSYFIDAEKKTLVETVKSTFWDTWLDKLQQVVDPSSLDYIVLDHTEPDHSGSVAKLLELAPHAVVVGSGNAIRYLQDMLGKPFEYLQVKDGDSLDLGNRTLRFIGAPNLHWPDTIYTWLEEDRLLFTCDSFGAHFCDERMFDDLVGDFDEAFRYYFDVILKPYSKFMLKAIEKIRPLDIAAICPGHGPILRTQWKKYVDLSERWASDYMDTILQEHQYILIAYVSAYGYTAEMAEHIARGIRSVPGLKVELADIEKMPLGEIEEKLVRAQALILGSPTINQNTLLPVYRLFSAVNPLRDKGKAATAFGSYGWSGEAVGIIESMLRNLKLNVVQPGISFKFYPHDEKAAELETFGKQFAEKLKGLQ